MAASSISLISFFLLSHLIRAKNGNITEQCWRGDYLIGSHYTEFNVTESGSTSYMVNCANTLALTIVWSFNESKTNELCHFYSMTYSVNTVPVKIYKDCYEHLIGQDYTLIDTRSGDNDPYKDFLIIGNGESKSCCFSLCVWGLSFLFSLFLPLFI